MACDALAGAIRAAVAYLIGRRGLEAITSRFPPVRALGLVGMSGRKLMIKNMEKNVTLEIYRDYKEGYSESELDVLARELSSHFGKRITLTEKALDDGYTLSFTLGN